MFLEHFQETRNMKEAFHNFRTKHLRTPQQPFPGKGMASKKNNAPRVPHIWFKMPTPGGKIFTARRLENAWTFPVSGVRAEARPVGAQHPCDDQIV